MALIRYNPWEELNAIQRQMNRLFEETRVPTAVLDKDFIKGCTNCP